ncbi:hypothetical protein P8C59_009200 [Phyllachora maydis]|uniref:SET domain-containing protein n=1 Tax=Phyllachora maydis TaxID=1825666 RepID=A0AAD9ICP2_9PEZI|nr:hypothetical protein P8C59_009200 [Phyllachora maydis]
MDPIDQLTEWAQEQGIVLDGVKPRRIPGKGIGIVATKRLKPGQSILEVPTSALRTLDTVPSALARRLPKDLTVHGLLAADLALDQTAKYAVWNALSPTRASIWSTLPLTWPPALQAHLPEAGQAVLRAQQAKLARDWAAVSQALGRRPFPALSSSSSGSPGAPLSEADYTYAWLLVETRTFYHSTARTERRLRRHDHMALQPVADLFNHGEAGCRVAFDAAGFSVYADRAYARGDEVVISYGAHGNDALLVEYGFVLGGEAGGGNRWDAVGLDGVVVPALGDGQREALEALGFLGGYVLDAEGACYRTQVALRVMCLPETQWRRFLEEGGDEGAEKEAGRRQKKVDRLLVGLLKKYEEGTVRRHIREIEASKVGEECQREILCRRWRQIQRLLLATLERLDG